MNKEQKCLIDQYRQSGMKYAEIARMIGLPETTVKSYCYRNPIQSVTSPRASMPTVREADRIREIQTPPLLL